MKFSVTQEHIDDGRVGSAYHCPIARCLNEALKPKEQIAVTPEYIYLNTVLDEYGNDVGNKVNTPAKAMDFIHSFDRRRNVAPFEFELDLETDK